MVGFGYMVSCSTRAASRGVVSLTILVGCAGPDDIPAIAGSSSSSTGVDDDERGSSTGLPPDPPTVVELDPPPPPILGGTLLVTRDGATALISDPDRDAIYVVDLRSHTLRTTLRLDPGSTPWRLVEGSDGRIHAILRGAGALLGIDLTDDRVVSVDPVCSTPRGVAASADAVTLACASGEVWRFDSRSREAEVVRSEPDLRDVFFDAQGQLRLTRMRSAEVLTLGTNGSLVDRVWPERRILDGESWVANTAWRTTPSGDGGWLMLHQMSTTQQIDVTRRHAYERPTVDCPAVVLSTVTAFAADGGQRWSGMLDVGLAVDVALDRNSGRVAVANAGSCGAHCPQVAIVELSEFSSESQSHCQVPTPVQPGDASAQMVAVAFAPDGALLVQQRDPAVLFVIAGDATRIIELSDASVEDTGHRTFHEVAPTGVSCASCHPEGGDDGLVWWLEDFRHTPALDIGLAGTAPFHWVGDLDSFSSLVREVQEHRMGAAEQTPEQIAATERWMNSLGPVTARPVDDVTRAGEALWRSYGCASCHAGAATTSNTTVAIDTTAIPLQVPSLRGVSVHPPWFHDGRAHTLADAVREMVVRTVPGSAPTPAEIAALVAYLETL